MPAQMDYFLDLRNETVGGSVAGSVKLLDGAGRQLPDSSFAVFFSFLQGREVLLVTHGFNVDQAGGVHSLGHWATLLDPSLTAVPVGVLWPGDAKHLSALSYPWEGDEAEHSGQLLARFINLTFAGAISVSFASHSLGARVVLECISRLDRGPRRLLLMAGAIDDNCLTNSYKSAAAKVQDISTLGSKEDNVLKLAFPLGNPLMGIFDHHHPFWHAALGRNGPTPTPSNIRNPAWQIPHLWDYGHGDYLGKVDHPDRYALPVELPPPDFPNNFPDNTPLPLKAGKNDFTAAWSAGLGVTRYR